jgi:hypothetical protein
LSRRERRVLRGIAKQLKREEPGLASLLTDKAHRGRPDYDAARRRRHEDAWNYGRAGRRRFLLLSRDF